jgi:hypothetical protein
VSPRLGLNVLGYRGTAPWKEALVVLLSRLDGRSGIVRCRKRVVDKGAAGEAAATFALSGYFLLAHEFALAWVSDASCLRPLNPAPTSSTRSWSS